LLLHTNHTEAKIFIKGTLIELERGQQARSQVTLAATWKWSRDKVKRYLKLLEKDGMITQKTSQLTSIITICNYKEYQHSKSADKATLDTPSKQQADSKQVTVKNVNNEENEKKKDIVIPEGINIDSWNEWFEYRKSKKQTISKQAATKQFNLLLSYDSSQQQQIIDKSISNDWRGLFDLKNNKSSNTSNIPFDEIANAYNTIFADFVGVNHVEEMTDSRMAAIEKIWNRKLDDKEKPTNSVGHFERYFEFAKTNEVLSGQDPKFTPSISTVTKYDTYIKTIEGAYNA
jgi:hypothetical protein